MGNWALLTITFTFMSFFDRVKGIASQSMRSGGVVALSVLAFAAWKWQQERQTNASLNALKDSVETMQKESRALQHKRNEERRGRIAAEKELKKMASKIERLEAGKDADGTNTNTNENGSGSGGNVASNSMRLSGSGKTMSIGYLRSTFKERNGAPRQGSVVEASRAYVTIDLGHGINAADALMGLEKYSHVWLLYVFHQNTNISKSSIRAKVKPPRLDGEKVGLFATRTPHRPNPIGLSVVKLEKIVDKTVHFSGVDLLDGTPILDIKPYVTCYDSVPAAITPQWISSAPVKPISVIKWSDQAESELLSFMPKLEFYSESEIDVVRDGIDQVLKNDIRPQHKRKAHASSSSGSSGDKSKSQSFGFCFDLLNIVFEYRMESGEGGNGDGAGDVSVYVVSVEYWPDGPVAGKEKIDQDRRDRKEKRKKKEKEKKKSKKEKKSVVVEEVNE